MTDWAELLRDLDLQESGLEAARTSQIVNYLQLLEKWQRTTNLIANATTPSAIIHLHVADSLALLPHLDEAGRIIDVGAGGGFPSLLLAIARPALALTALEPVHKKHAFLATARRELRLDNFTPLAERDDQHRRRPDFAPYDIAVSRAAFAPDEWLQRGATLIRPGGTVLAMEGRDRIDLPSGARRHPYELTDRSRAIIAWRPG